ncbi:MAG: hypothetical protein Q4F72_12115, partial [Desulfovibrionaceae bacterium]|nr:hypothetical protein [Desulfovibrionaceae bacterium]
EPLSGMRAEAPADVLSDALPEPLPGSLPATMAEAGLEAAGAEPAEPEPSVMPESEEKTGTASAAPAPEPEQAAVTGGHDDMASEQSLGSDEDAQEAYYCPVCGRDLVPGDPNGPEEERGLWTCTGHPDCLFGTWSENGRPILS